MSETEPHAEQIEQFRAELREALATTLFIITSGQEPDPIDVDPFSLGMGDETIADLPEYADIISDELYRQIGMKPGDPPIAAYQTKENINVSIYERFETDEEGNEVPYYLHEIVHSDGNKDWQLSASSDPTL